MPSINPHINFNENAGEAFHFYRSVFGGEFARIIRFRDIAGEAFPVAEKEADKIMHISLPIGKDRLIGNDVPEILGRVDENENRSKISVSTESREEALRLFNGLSAGGTVEIPIDETAAGCCFGMFRDKFGIEWIVEFDLNHGDV